MPQHVDGGLALLERYVAEQRLEQTVARLHVEKQNLAIDRLEPLDADFDRTADRSLYELLGRRLTVDLADDPQIAEPRLPGPWQDQIGRARIDQRVALQHLVFGEEVRDPDVGDDAAHFLLGAPQNTLWRLSNGEPRSFSAV